MQLDTFGDTYILSIAGRHSHCISDLTVALLDRKHSASVTAAVNTTGDGHLLAVLGVDEGRSAPEAGDWCIRGQLGGDGGGWDDLPCNSHKSMLHSRKSPEHRIKSVGLMMYSLLKRQQSSGGR